jgi:two-component system, OmpR family, phosphate regulon response regulator OmpR
MTPPKRILVLDRGDVRQIIAELLVDLGYVVTLAEGAARMRAELDTGGIDLIVLDATASDAETITLASVARDRGVRLVMISGRPATIEAYHDRADQLLRKPFTREELRRAVDYAFASGTFGQRKEDPD